MGATLVAAFKVFGGCFGVWLALGFIILAVELRELSNDERN